MSFLKSINQEKQYTNSAPTSGKLHKPVIPINNTDKKIIHQPWLLENLDHTGAAIR